MDASTMTLDEAAAASAVCAAKSAGWESLRRSNSGEQVRAVTHADMRQAEVMAEEFRSVYYPEAAKAFGLGDRTIGQPFEMYVVDEDGPRRIWAEAMAR